MDFLSSFGTSLVGALVDILTSAIEGVGNLVTGSVGLL